MSMIITPESAIKLIISCKTQDFNLNIKLYDTRLQKWLFWLSATGNMFAIIGGVINLHYKNEVIALIAIICLFIAAIMMLMYQIASILPELGKFKNMERSVSNPLLAAFNEDIELMNELANTYELHHLSYAKVSYGMMAKQLRERISILVGAIDKVGVIPFLITGYISYANAQKQRLLQFDSPEWIGVALVALYLLAIRLTKTAQWMENVAEIYAHAIMLKSNGKAK